MNRATLLGVVMILALVLAACAPGTPTEAPTLSVPVTGDTETPVVAMTDTEMATEMPVETSTSEMAAETPTTDAGATTGVTISTTTSANLSEPLLVDQQGRTLYLFTSDTQNSGASACSADCLANWPPVLVSGMPQAGTGVDPALLGTITRDDGTTQATYNGWPLYYYVSDMAPGDMSGQGVGGVWFVVSATGKAIQQ